jgi:thiosulfate dehydrogenase (quinone) large subunit
MDGGTDVSTILDPPIQEEIRLDLHSAGEPEHRKSTPGLLGGRIWGALRLAIGWVFLWAFLDKLLGLGFSTGRDSETGAIDFFSDGAWINGGSPTSGFLENGLHTKGFLVDFYGSLAGSAFIDWVYMASMLFIGAALMLGILTRLAAVAGIAWMLMFYTASALWPENNPVIDDHIIYAIVLAGIAIVSAGRYLGFGRRWERVPMVSRHSILR